MLVLITASPKEDWAAHSLLRSVLRPLTSVLLSRSDLNSREQETCQPVHVINVDIQDNHEEATLGAFLICELCQCVSIGPWAGLRRAHRGFSMNVTSTPLGSRSAYCQTL